MTTLEINHNQYCKKYITVIKFDYNINEYVIIESQHIIQSVNLNNVCKQNSDKKSVQRRKE